ncbi:hypothetical protein [Nostoc sp.]
MQSIALALQADALALQSIALALQSIAKFNYGMGILPLVSS